MEVSASKENGSLPLVPEDKLMKCESNRMDNTFDVNDASEDVDIILSTNCCDNRLVESDSHDESENSSSFGNTLSGIEDCSVLSDAEVESKLYCSNISASVSEFDGFGETFLHSKKRLTDHWRKFIRPLMWRCKWIELQIKEFKSQASKYDKELAEFDKLKQLAYEMYMVEDFDAKALPFSSQIRQKKVMKRKKRKRVEETVDMTSYLSQHNLFSYFENKRVVTGPPLDDDYGNTGNTINENDEFGLNDGWSSLEFRNGDSSLEPILCKIEEVQSQVRKLKTRIDKVLSEHPRKFCSINKLSSHVPFDALNGSDKNPAPKIGEGIPVKSQYNSLHRISNRKKGDLPVSESAGLNNGEVTPLPNMIEFTDQHQVMGSSYDNIEDEVLIHNQEGKEDLHSFETIGSQLIKKPKEEHSDTLVLVGAPEVAAKNSLLSVSVRADAQTLSTSKLDIVRYTRRLGNRKS